MSGCILCSVGTDKKRNSERESTWQCFELNVKILNIERERQFPIAPAFNLYPNSARNPLGILGRTWRGGDENSPSMRLELRDKRAGSGWVGLWLKRR